MKMPAFLRSNWQPFLVVAAIVCFVGFTFPENSLKEIVPKHEIQESGYASSVGVDQEIGKAEDLVKDWQKPEFVLFITGRQHGYIEPCGCITLERQKGGLMRRHRVMKILEQRGWDVVPIDAGNQVRRIGQQPLIKLARTYESLCRVMDYDLIGLGPDDLKLAPIDLVQKMETAKQGEKNPFTSANVVPFGGAFTENFQVIEKNGKRIGVTTVVGKEHVAKMGQVTGLEVVDPAEALQKVVPAMEAANCDMKVLVAFTNLANCRDLAKQFPVFDVLVTAGGAGDPTLQPEIIQTRNGQVTSMVQVGVKGMYVGLIGWFSNNGQPKIEYKRVQLDHRYKDTEEIKTVFKAYQDELKDLWLRGVLKDIKPRSHPTGNTFVGSDKCADCHDDEFDIWENGVDGEGGPHYDATEDLAQNPNDNRVWVQRNFDPECVSCHATGWNPQNYYPYESGMLDAENAKFDHLHANGCENCHGPGSAHVEMELKAAKGNVDQKLRDQLTRQMVVTLDEARATACKECHDLDNSPDFLKEGGFDKYWPKVKHGRTAVKKIHDLLSDIVEGKRPLQDVNGIQQWVSDLKSQSPSQVALVENALANLRSTNNPMLVVKSTLDRIDDE